MSARSSCRTTRRRMTRESRSARRARAISASSPSRTVRNDQPGAVADVRGEDRPGREQDRAGVSGSISSSRRRRRCTTVGPLRLEHLGEAVVPGEYGGGTDAAPPLGAARRIYGPRSRRRTIDWRAGEPARKVRLPGAGQDCVGDLFRRWLVEADFAPVPSRS